MSLPQVKFISLSVTAGEGFTLELRNVAEQRTYTTPRFPASAGFPLAVAVLAAAKVNSGASIGFPELGGMLVGDLEDLGSELLAFYPGPLAQGGLPALMAALGV